MVVLGSPKAMFELLEKKSANTSDRPGIPLMALYVFHTLLIRFRGGLWIGTNCLTSTAMDTNLTMMPYGERWRRHKRAFRQYFHSGAIPSYQPIQRSAAHRFLNKLLKTPSELRTHIRLYVSTLCCERVWRTNLRTVRSTFFAAVVKVVFGIDVADDGDEILAVVESALEWIGEAFIPGKYLVDVFPILQHVPAWVPGATVQRLAVYW